MKKVIIELPEGIDEVISITAIGNKEQIDGKTLERITNVFSRVFDLEKGTRIRFDGEKWTQEEVTE